MELIELITKHINDIDGTPFLTFGFKPRIVKGEPVVKEPAEIEKWEWFDPKELPNPIYVPTKKIIEEYYSKK